MKRILFFILFTVTSLGVFAQKGLSVADFFTDTYASNPDVTMISLSGNQIHADGLKIYKSLSVSGNKEIADKVAEAVRKDGSRAKSKEVSYNNGQLYFGFYFLGGSGTERQYLLFLDRRAMGKDKTTIIYIKGDMDTEGIKKLIK